MKVVTVEQMRQIEAAADAAGHSYAAMMELAGRAVAQAILARLDGIEKRVLVLVGPGNNGGDGLVAVRYLAEAGTHVVCYLLRSREDDDLQLVQYAGLDVLLAPEDDGLKELERQVLAADVLVDALLGTGTRLPLRGTLAQILYKVGQVLSIAEQASGEPLVWLDGYLPPKCPQAPLIVAVDGPTGLDYDTGELDEAALSADLTVTFAYPKVGHFLFPGASALGELAIADIGTDPALANDIPLEVVTSRMVREILPSRPPWAHKGTFGKALVVAGSLNYAGAAYLAGAAATRAGAGLVTVALPEGIHASISSHLVEATYLPLPQDDGAIAAGAAQVLAGFLLDYDAVLLGPGLGRQRGTAAFVGSLLDESGERATQLPPLVVDADALNILSELEDWPRVVPGGSILTPHPGEMARLMGSSIGEVQADRIAVVRSCAASWGQVVVLKGAYTVIAAPDGRTALEPFADAALATAGTGDVLAGTITALRSQGLTPFEAAVAGAYLHGLAGKLAGRDEGRAGTVAGDLISRLPRAWQQVVGR